MTCLCSIVIPAKNEAEDIGACLESLCAQSTPRDVFEIIVVDNGSDDDTANIAKKFADIVRVYPHIRVGAVRNRGVDLASGEVVVFLDADCQVDAGWLQRGLEMLSRQRERCHRRDHQGQPQCRVGGVPLVTEQRPAPAERAHGELHIHSQGRLSKRRWV